MNLHHVIYWKDIWDNSSAMSSLGWRSFNILQCLHLVWIFYSCDTWSCNPWKETFSSRGWQLIYCRSKIMYKSVQTKHQQFELHWKKSSCWLWMWAVIHLQERSYWKWDRNVNEGLFILCQFYLMTWCASAGWHHTLFINLSFTESQRFPLCAKTPGNKSWI